LSPVLPFTRFVFVVGVCLTAGTGVGLFAVPDRTADYWAWTIKAPLSAALFGAGYITAAVSLALAARERVWERARIVAVAAFTLTSLALLATLVSREPFAFGEGGLRELVAWVWLAVYVALPPLVLVAFVRQERVAGRPPPQRPARHVTRVLLGALGLLFAVLGVLLVAEWRELADRWPWPLPALPARVVGAWLATYAASLLWFAVRDYEWARARIVALPGLILVLLNLVAALRFHDDFHGTAATTLYIAGLAALAGAVIAAEVLEVRRAGDR
jgi:hypothetical protein